MNFPGTTVRPDLTADHLRRLIELTWTAGPRNWAWLTRWLTLEDYRKGTATFRSLPVHLDRPEEVILAYEDSRLWTAASDEAYG